MTDTTYINNRGEHFHAHWDVEPLHLNPKTSTPEPSIHLDLTPSAEAITAAGRSSPYIIPSYSSSSSSSTSTSSATSIKTTATTDEEEEDEGEGGKTRIVLLNEQVSHHPPISHFRLEARGPKGTVSATGADQLGAKFTGTSKC